MGLSVSIGERIPCPNPNDYTPMKEKLLLIFVDKIGLGILAIVFATVFTASLNERSMEAREVYSSVAPLSDYIKSEEESLFESLDKILDVLGSDVSYNEHGRDSLEKFTDDAAETFRSLEEWSGRLGATAEKSKFEKCRSRLDHSLNRFLKDLNDGRRTRVEFQQDVQKLTIDSLKEIMDLLIIAKKIEVKSAKIGLSAYPSVLFASFIVVVLLAVLVWIVFQLRTEVSE